MSKNKSGSVSQSLSQWQGHLLSCQVTAKNTLVFLSTWFSHLKQAARTSCLYANCQARSSKGDHFKAHLFFFSEADVFISMSRKYWKQGAPYPRQLLPGRHQEKEQECKILDRSTRVLSWQCTEDLIVTIMTSCLYIGHLGFAGGVVVGVGLYLHILPPLLIFEFSKEVKCIGQYLAGLSVAVKNWDLVFKWFFVEEENNFCTVDWICPSGAIVAHITLYYLEKSDCNKTLDKWNIKQLQFSLEAWKKRLKKT